MAADVDPGHRLSGLFPMSVLLGHLEDMTPRSRLPYTGSSRDPTRLLASGFREAGDAFGSGGHRQGHRSGACRWETIQYALDSTARTVRLCVIMLVASVPPGAFVWLLLHR